MGPKCIWVNLHIADAIYSKGIKFVARVKINTTGDSKLKGRFSRFSACPYTDRPVHTFWHRPRFFIVYEPIVSKLPNFACKMP